MAFTFIGPDPVEDQLHRVLERLAAGDRPGQIEVVQVEVKEELGRRGPKGVILTGTSQNDAAARYLAGEMACLANTPGGGAIILGVADDGARIGTALDPEWLRHRIWQLTEQRLTVTVREVDLAGVRLLALTTHEAIEPVRHDGRLRWRVDDNCVEIDATTWHAGKLQRSGIDWSAQPSGHALADVNPVAVQFARRYLQGAGDEGALGLADATTEDLLRRLNVVGGDGRLTNAGSLLFVRTPAAAIDYIRRDVPAGDSTNRVPDPQRRQPQSLLEQMWEVDQASQAANRLVHIPVGFAHGQVRAIPSRAMREAIVNGIVHRDWLSRHPTTVEHIGDVLTVTSPGGLIGGVRPSNIITHPAVPRYRSLAEAVVALRLAEREGIGIDRMVRDMLALGHREPEISEVEGPYVRVGLIGGMPDVQVLEFLGRLEPAGVSNDVDALLILNHLIRHGWVDADEAQPVIQRPAGETESAMNRLAAAHVGKDAVISPISGIPPGRPVAYRLSDAARALLDRRVSHLNTPAGRKGQALSWSTSRGRVSSTEVVGITGISLPSAGALLTDLETEGLLARGRERKRGRGFHYIPNV